MPQGGLPYATPYYGGGGLTLRRPLPGRGFGFGLTGLAEPEPVNPLEKITQSLTEGSALPSPHVGVRPAIPRARVDLGNGQIMDLPGTGGLSQSLLDYDELVSQTKSQQVDPQLLQQAAELAAQNAAARGLEGGYAASLATSAQGKLLQAHKEAQIGRLAQLLRDRAGVSLQIRQQENDLRQAQAARDAAVRAEAQRRRAEAIRLIGMLVGGTLGLVGGPAGAAAGASLGGAGGSALGGILE